MNLKQKQLLRIMPIAFLLAFALLLSHATTTHAAHPPLEYKFENDPGAEFNGIAGMKRMRITFPGKQLLISDISMGNNIYVEHSTGKVDIIEPLQIEGDTVTVSFKNIQYLDLTDQDLDYELVIERGANLHFDQTEEYRLPFKLYEALPGFESVFIQSPAEKVNQNILKNNSYRDIVVHIPKMYLTGIETIHRYKGLVDPGMESHSMTNMDVFAEAEATRLKVSVNDEDQYARDLEYRPSIKGFTLGQAGLEALVCETENNCQGSAKNFHLTAFDKYGKLLSTRNFKVRVLNPVDGFTVNDYITKPDRIFGQQTTVYDLMSNPNMLQTIASQMPVTDLDTLGVTYSLGSVVEVESMNQLQMALKNPMIKTVQLKNTISGDVKIDRNLTIVGNEHHLLGDIEVSGEEVTVRLKDTTVEGDITSHVDSNSFTILENVYVSGETTIADGSLHLFNFNSPHAIRLQGTDDMRAVSVGSKPSLTVETSEEIELVGTFSNVEILDEDAHITMRNSTDIDKILIDEPNHLTLQKTRDKAMPEKVGTGTIDVIDLDPPVGEDGQIITEWYYPEMLAQSSEVWKEIGVKLTLDQAPSQVDWKVMNPKVFGNQSEVIYKDGLLHIVDVTAEQTQEIVLQGSYDGQVYRVMILAEVELEY